MVFPHPALKVSALDRMFNLLVAWRTFKNTRLCKYWVQRDSTFTLRLKRCRCCSNRQLGWCFLKFITTILLNGKEKDAIAFYTKLPIFSVWATPFRISPASLHGTLCKISNTKDGVLPHFQTPRSELKM